MCMCVCKSNTYPGEKKTEITTVTPKQLEVARQWSFVPSLLYNLARLTPWIAFRYFPFMFEVSCSGKLLLLISSSCSKVIHIKFAYVPKYGESKYSRVVSPSPSVSPIKLFIWHMCWVLVEPRPCSEAGQGGEVSPGDLTKFPPLCPEEFTRTQ